MIYSSVLAKGNEGSFVIMCRKRISH